MQQRVGPSNFQLLSRTGAAKVLSLASFQILVPETLGVKIVGNEKLPRSFIVRSDIAPCKSRSFDRVVDTGSAENSKSAGSTLLSGQKACP